MGMIIRWVRSVREECLDHILVLNEHHLHSVLREYGEYYKPRQITPGLMSTLSCDRARTELKKYNTKTRNPGRCHPRFLQAAFRFGFWLWIVFLHHTG